MKMIDRLTVRVEPLYEFLPASRGVLRIRFQIDGDGEHLGYDLIIDQKDLTKSVFDHMWESAKMKIEEAFVKKPETIK